VLSLGDLPLANAFVQPETQDIADERFPLELVFCRSCALVQLDETVSPDKLFTEYPYFSSQSQTFVDHAGSLVERVVKDYDLGDGDLAMEIASNDGYLLQHYRRAGVSVLGIDPARNVAVEAERRGIPTIAEFFDAALADRLRGDGVDPKVIHANNVLAHVPDIRHFVDGVSRVLRDEGVWIVEIPYVRDLVEKLEFDTIYHEHVFYYSLASLRRLLEASSLTIIDVERLSVHGGSLRVFASRDGVGEPDPRVGELEREEEDLGIESIEYYSSFSQRVSNARAEISSFLRDLRGHGARLAGYGAAAKGTMLLNSLSLEAGTIEYVVDSTPYKQGRLIPGVRVPIESPDRLVEDPPDYVLLLAWNVAAEIIDREADYVARGGRFIIPLPSPYVVTQSSEVID
jgi:C-methyltransferase-like protein/putative zinc binding protein/methyltransferase family protein